MEIALFKAIVTDMLEDNIIGPKLSEILTFLHEHRVLFYCLQESESDTQSRATSKALLKKWNTKILALCQSRNEQDRLAAVHLLSESARIANYEFLLTNFAQWQETFVSLFRKVTNLGSLTS